MNIFHTSIVANRAPNPLSFLKDSGSGSFSSFTVSLAPPNQPSDVAKAGALAYHLGDPDGDGHLGLTTVKRRKRRPVSKFAKKTAENEDDADAEVDEVTQEERAENYERYKLFTTVQIARRIRAHVEHYNNQRISRN